MPGSGFQGIYPMLYAFFGADGELDRESDAERLYRDILPVLTFVIQSLETLHCYGKRIMARRFGLKRVYDRAPGLRSSDIGLACTERYARMLEMP